MRRRTHQLSGFMVVLTACEPGKGDGHLAETRVAHPPVQAKDAFILTTMNGFPAEVDGCSCYYATSKAAFQQKQFIYVANYGDTGLISINNQLKKVHLKETDKNDVTLTIILKMDEQNGDETSWQTGEMRVKSKNGQVITTEFAGKYGC